MMKNRWLMYGIGILLLIGAVFLGDVLGITEIVSFTFAQAPDSVSETEIALASNLQLILRLVFMLLRPMIAIVGATLDNSLVLGEVFYLNVSIYSMRQIMRNFANFALGGIFLFALLRNMISAMSGTEEYISGERGIKKLLPKMLLAAILVQSSFFLMNSLISLSTIAIYSIGALPINVISSEDRAKGGLSNVSFLKADVKYRIDNTIAKDGSNSTYSVFYGCPGTTTTFIPCKFNNNIMAPSGDENADDTRENHKKVQATNRASHGSESVDTIKERISDQYCVYGSSLVDMGNIASTGNDSYFGKKVDFCKMRVMREDVEIVKGGGSMAEMNCPTLASFFDKSAGMTGPMYALFASIMRMEEIAQTPNHKDEIEISLEFLVKLASILGLFFPLVALAIAMVMRLVALWGFIIFSPMLVVGRVFFKEGIDAKNDKASFSSLIGLVFMPVLVVFAISISMIFLTLMSRSEQLNVTSGSDKGAASALDTQYEAGADCDAATGVLTCKDTTRTNCGNINDHCYDLAGITSLCFTESQISIGNSILNVFSYLLVNFFGIAMMWMVVFAAMESSKITAGVTETVKGLGTDLAKLTPIPLAGGLSYNDMENRKNQLMQIPTTMASDQSSKFWAHNKKMEAQRGVSKGKIQTDLTAAGDDVAKIDAAISSGVAAQTSYKNHEGKGFFKKLGLLAGVANPGSMKSLQDLVSTKEGFEWIRTYGGDTDDLVEAGKKLNKVSGADGASITKEFNADIKAGLKAQSTVSGSNVKKINDNRYYYSKDKTKEFISFDGDTMSVQKVGKIETAVSGGGIDITKMNAILDDIGTTNIDLPGWMKELKDNRKPGATSTREIAAGKAGVYTSSEIKGTKELSKIDKANLLVEYSAGKIISISQGTK